jgi:hypothetical protein
MLFGKKEKKPSKPSYDKENQKPVIRASICNGEQVAGFRDIHTGEFCRNCSDAGERGYIHLTVAEDQFDPKRDNKELMIADYVFDPIGTGAELKDNPDMWI